MFTLREHGDDTTIGGVSERLGGETRRNDFENSIRKRTFAFYISEACVVAAGFDGEDFLHSIKLVFLANFPVFSCGISLQTSLSMLR